MLSLTSIDNQGSGIEYVSSRVQRLECWFVTCVIVEGDSGRYQSIPRTNANASHMNHAHSTLGRSSSTLSSSAGAAYRMHQCTCWERLLLAIATSSVATPSKSMARRRLSTPITLRAPVIHRLPVGVDAEMSVVGFQEWQDSGWNERSRGGSSCDNGGEERRVCAILRFVLGTCVLYTSWIWAHRLACVITRSARRSAKLRRESCVTRRGCTFRSQCA